MLLATNFQVKEMSKNNPMPRAKLKNKNKSQLVVCVHIRLI